MQQQQQQHQQQQQQQKQPLATISIQDLTSVQLRRTNVKMQATKTFSAPPNRSVSMTNGQYANACGLFPGLGITVK
jgi:hypothetical protein